MTNPEVRRVVIVGGGSAGWITAGSLAAAFKNANIDITLIESPDVNIIGVGEGTWPSMRSTLQQMGIDEFDFLRHCDASFKQGSKFINWANDEAGHYYHPFTTPAGYTQTCLYSGWHEQSFSHSFADTVCPQSHVCEAGLAPKQLATPAYAAVANYGYHLDAGKFANLLQHHCVEKLGVTHLLAHVNEIINNESGDIDHLLTREAGEVNGDLFIDCTGMPSKLLGEHFGVPFVDKANILFNNKALATQVPYANATDNIASATLSTAQTAGWIWDIGLQSRRGVGYTYSAAHIDDERAERELRAYIAQSRGQEVAEQLNVRHLQFRPGHREHFWHRNCLAIGLSAGFLEPLEASALALVELSVTMLKDEFPTNRAHMKIVANRFNERFRYRWDRVIEFLKLHYTLSKRTSEYWQDNLATTSIPARLQDLMALWQYQPPSRHDFIQNEEVFPSASYQYVLYGMGYPTQPRRDATPQLTTQLFAQNQQKTQQYLSGLPSNRDLLHELVHGAMAKQA